MNHQHINPPELLRYPGLSQVVVAQGRRTVYIAGQVSCDKDYKVIGEGDYFVQIGNALRNLKTAVEAAGGRVRDIVSSTVYVNDYNEVMLKALSEAWAVALDGEPFPAHAYTLVQVGLGGQLLVEIASVAVLD